MKTSQALTRVASFGLPGAVADSFSVESFPELMALTESQRMLPWLSAAVSSGQVENVTDDERDALQGRALVAVQVTLAAHAMAASVVKRFHAAGVSDIRVLKGCATAYLDYAPLGYRYSSDVDLLIRLDDYDRALTVFEAAEIPAHRRKNWQRRYGKATTVRDAVGVEIDIHTTLSPGYFGLALPVDELMAHSDRFRIGDVELSSLDGPGRLIHAATHAGQSGYVGMHSMRDVLQLVLHSEVDWQDAVDRTTRWKVQSLFALGVLATWGTFDVDDHPLVDWARGDRPKGRQRLALHMVADRRQANQLAAPLALPLYRWPGYLLPLVFPSRPFLAAVGKDWRAQARSIWHGLRRS